MAITTTQFNLINTLVALHMENPDIEMSINSDKELFSQVVESFDIDVTNPNHINEVEVATMTLENVVKNIVDMYDMNVFSELSDYYDFDETLEIIENESIIFHSDVFEMSEVAENYLNDTDGIEHHAENYIDEDSLLRDLYLGGDIADYYYNMVKEDALYNGMEEEEAEKVALDYEISDSDEIEYLNLVIECAGKEFLSRYFDYEKFGRDMELDGNYITSDSGIIEVIA